ncbi:MAG: GerMN domain-containing protein [Clostridium sp.]
MRRRIFAILLAILTLSFVLTSCGKNEAKAPTPDGAKPQAEVNFKEYFPFAKDTILKYVGSEDNKSYKVMVKSTDNNTIVLSSTKDTTIKFSNDGILINDNYILKLPLNPNSSWDIEGGKVTLKNTNYALSTKLGDFYAYEIEVTKNNSVFTVYFVKNLGIAKVTSTVDNKTSEYTLYSIEGSIKNESAEKPDENLSANVDNFYYYDVEKDSVIKKPIDKNTSSKDAKQFFEDLFKMPPTGINPLMPNTTKINSIKVDKSKSLVTLDVSETFTETMNLGTSGEEGILQSIANTIGKSYGCKKVIITVKGEPYATGHIIIDRDNPLTVE